MDRQVLQWTDEDNFQSYKQGWGVFICDIGRFEIEGLTHESGLLKDGEPENDFEGEDDKAVAFVIRQALDGDRLAIKALVFCWLNDPFSMSWVMSNMLDHFLPTGLDGEFQDLMSALEYESIPPEQYRKLAKERSVRIREGKSVLRKEEMV